MLRGFYVKKIEYAEQATFNDCDQAFIDRLNYYGIYLNEKEICIDLEYVEEIIQDPDDISPEIIEKLKKDLAHAKQNNLASVDYHYF
jgi:predicted nucleotidyltransferase